MNSENLKYCGTWASAQYSGEGNMPDVSLNNKSIRQIVKTTIDGNYIRLKFSNQMGEKPLVIKEAHIAISAGQGTGKIKSETDTIITFNGKSETTIPAGEVNISDTIQFSLPELCEVAVTIAFGDLPKILTSHVGSRTFTYIENGNVCSKEIFTHENKTPHWFVLSAIDVVIPENSDKKLIVCLGDSITDGRGTTDDKQNRWTDIFAERLHQNSATKNLAVINQGIGGTCIGGKDFYPKGPAGQSRFQRDVLDQPGIKGLIILYGVNDILFANASSDKIISIYKEIIQLVHEHGIKVFGGTILPFGKNSGWTEEKENVRKAVNGWILNTDSSDGGFDGKIDFAKAMEDPENKLYLNTNWNFEDDGLHPNAAGYNTMGNLINLDLFTNL